MRSPTLSPGKRLHLADMCCLCSAHAAVLVVGGVHRLLETYKCLLQSLSRSLCGAGGALWTEGCRVSTLLIFFLFFFS